MCSCHSILECCVMFSGVKLSIRLFVIFIDPFGEHVSRPEEPTDENIPLDLVTPGGLTWERTREQETSFGGRESQRTKLMKDYVKDIKI